MFWKLGSLSSRCKQIQCLVRTCFLKYDGFLPFPFPGEEQGRSFLGPSKIRALLWFKCLCFTHVWTWPPVRWYYQLLPLGSHWVSRAPPLKRRFWPSGKTLLYTYGPLSDFLPYDDVVAILSRGSHPVRRNHLRSRNQFSPHSTLAWLWTF